MATMTSGVIQNQYSLAEKSLPSAYPDCRRKSVAADLVAQIAKERPDAIALTAACGQLTYGELNSRADRLARYLRSLGAGPEVLVGVCLNRSFDQIVTILAVMKSGAAFLPLDPAWPTSRLQKLLDDAQAPLVITGADHAEALAADGRTAIVPDRDRAKIASAAGEIAAVVHRENLAYVIYTSGSTGEPKGAEITHGNLLNLIFWHRSAFSVTAADRASHLAGLGFDASIWEVWPYLTAGAEVVLVDDSVRTAPDLLRRFIVDEKINVAFVPTALAEPMIAADWPADTALHFLLTGADTLHGRPRATLPFALINNYGPTECTVVATSGSIDAVPDTELPPIGAPIANTNIYLLDENRMPVAAGDIGEIYIGGSGVGRGYRNRDAMTAEKFLPDPFRQSSGALMYRTGDLGRLRPDNQVGFHGRIDNQEKIRGHRVEPEEITAALGRHPQVMSCAVVARGDGQGAKQLVAYVVPAEGVPNSNDLHAFLAALLPDYMIPSAFVRIDTLPLTTSGKLDREALPAPCAANALGRSESRAPQTPTEICLAEIVAGVLNVPQIGLDDNFFMTGGHSLLGTQVVMRARDDFGVDLTLRHLFAAPTVAKLAAVIEKLAFEKVASMSLDEAALKAAS
jgi:amino acid adenylation domain-containing protein